MQLPLVNRAVSWLRKSSRMPVRTALPWFGIKSNNIYVDHDIALTYATYFTCVRLISETLMVLPWTVVEQANGRRRPAPEHPVNRLLELHANDEMDAGRWRVTSTGHLLSAGNCYSEIERSRAGIPVALHLLTPDRVQAARDGAGNLVYEVNNYRSGNSYIKPRDMFHVAGLGYDGILGYSIISYAHQILGGGIAMDRFSSTYFSNGTHLGGVIEYDEELDEEEGRKFLQSFNRAYKGENGYHKVGLLQYGMKFKPFEMKAQDAELINSKKLQAIDVCRFLRVPPSRVYQYDDVNNNNAEQANKEFMQDSIMPWGNRFQREARRKLLGPQEQLRFTTQMDVSQLIAGDTKAQSERDEADMKWGIRTRNEIRADRGMNPIEHGDTAYVPLNMLPLGETPPDQLPQAPGQQPTPTVTPGLNNSFSWDDVMSAAKRHGMQIEFGARDDRVTFRPPPDPEPKIILHPN